MKSFLALPAVTQYFLFLVLIFVPFAGIAGYVQIRRGKPLRPKRERYRSIVVVQLVILAITLAAAWRQSFVLFGSAGGDPLLWMGALAYLALIALRAPRVWAKKTPEQMELSRRLLPDEPSLMRWWVVISALAGISEECAFRGLAWRLLVGMGLNLLVAVLVCAVAFAIGHMTQGWRGVLGTFVLALLFHAMVFATRSLYLAIVFHAAFNLIVGIVAVRAFGRVASPVESPQPVEV